jgi:epoxyqueuosine reductase
MNALLDEHIQWAEQQQTATQERNRKTERLIRIVEKGLPRDA